MGLVKSDFWSKLDTRSEGSTTAVAIDAGRKRLCIGLDDDVCPSICLVAYFFQKQDYTSLDVTYKPEAIWDHLKQGPHEGLPNYVAGCNYRMSTLVWPTRNGDVDCQEQRFLAKYAQYYVNCSLKWKVCNLWQFRRYLLLLFYLFCLFIFSLPPFGE